MATERKRDSVRARRVCFEHHRQQDNLGVFLRCAICERRIDPVRQSREWRADHWPTRWADGGTDTPENLRPICLSCDAGPKGKAAEDTREIAKGKRIRERHFGIRQKKPWKPDGYKYDWSSRRYVKVEECE